MAAARVPGTRIPYRCQGWRSCEPECLVERWDERCNQGVSRCSLPRSFHGAFAMLPIIIVGINSGMISENTSSAIAQLRDDRPLGPGRFERLPALEAGLRLSHFQYWTHWPQAFGVRSEKAFCPRA